MAALATERERQGSGVPMKTKGGPSGTLALWDAPQSHGEVPRGCEGTQGPWASKRTQVPGPHTRRHHWARPAWPQLPRLPSRLESGLRQGRVPQHGTAMPLPPLRKPSERGSAAGRAGPKSASAPCSAARARFPGTSAVGYSRRGACRFLKGRAAVSQEPAPAQPPLAGGEAPSGREGRGPSSCCGDRQQKAAHLAGGCGAAGQAPFLLCCQRQP